MKINVRCMFSLFNPFKPSVLFYGASANSENPDQTPRSLASDQALHCLRTKCTFRI